MKALNLGKLHRPKYFPARPEIAGMALKIKEIVKVETLTEAQMKIETAPKKKVPSFTIISSFRDRFKKAELH